MSPNGADGPDANGAASRHQPDNAAARVRSVRDEPARVWTNDDFTIADDLAGHDLSADDLGIGVPSRPVVGPAIRRRAFWWCAAGLAGLLLGTALFHADPPPYKADTWLLLAQSSSADAPDQMLTEIALAQSRTVAETAMQSLGLPLAVKAVEAFQAHYAVTSQTDQILVITQKATSPSVAVQRAGALAAAFLQVRDDQLTTEQASTFSALNQQVSQDKTQLVSLEAQISALPAHAPPASEQAELAALQAKKSQDSGTLAGLEQSVNSYEATSRVQTDSVVHGSKVLDAAALLPRSHLKYPVLFIGGGLAAGAAIGLGLVTVLALISTRLRRRDDVSRALGTPVLRSFGRIGTGRWSWRRGLAAANRGEIRQLASELRKAVPEHAGTAALAVVAVDDVRVAALSVASLALSYAGEGRRIVVADLTRGAVAGRLLGVTSPGIHTAAVGDQLLTVALPVPGDVMPVGPIRVASGAQSRRPDKALAAACASADVLLSLAVPDPAVTVDYLATWAGDAVVILTAGQSSATRIQTIGEMIRHAGIRLASAVLLGADKSDVSLGVAREQASAQAAGPFRAERVPPARADEATSLSHLSSDDALPRVIRS